MRRLGLPLAVVVGAGLVVGSTAMPAVANDRDAYERSLSSPPQQLRPPALLGHDWVGNGTGISGDATLDRGELIVEDRPFDDTGADTSPLNGPPVQAAVDAGTLSGLCGPGSLYSTGDLSYPAGDTYRKNSADLVQLRLAVESGRLHVLWQLETLVDVSTTSVSLLLDTDRAATTGSAGGFAGFDRLLEVRAGKGLLDGQPVTSQIDLGANTVEAVVPLSSLPRGPWRVNAVSAVLPSGAVADAAFVDDEPVAGAKACKLDQVQSGRLARNSLDGVLVDPVRLAAGPSDRPALRRGAFTRSYVPTLALGEGRVGQPRYGQTSSADIYRGTVQPYAVYVPKSYDPAKKNPVILLLHCLTCWHSVYSMSDLPVELAESRGALIVTPFGYGEGGHYEAEAQKDAFEVLSDVSRRYSVDQERLYLTGMSMGSLGTFRLGGLFPDMWARLLPVAPYTTPFCITATPRTPGCQLAFNYLDIFENYRNVPVGIVQGTLDELTPVTGGREFADTLAALRFRFRYWEFPTRTHDPKLHGLTTSITDPFLADARRERGPATVSYVQDRAMQTPGQVYDRAYWLSDMRLSEGVRFGRVLAQSGRGTEFSTSPSEGSGTTDAGMFSFRGLDEKPAPPAGGNILILTLTGVDRVAVDLAPTGLTLREEFSLRAESDRPVRVQLGSRVVNVPAGSSSFTFPAEQGAPQAAPNRPSGPLPATGPGSAPALTASLLVLALLVRRVSPAGRSRSSRG